MVAGSDGAGAPLTVAYFVSQYPHLSHAFIEREVRAVRAAGVEVVTVSVHPANPEGLLSEADRADAARTLVIQGQGAAARALTALSFALLRQPRALLSTVRRAATSGPATPRGRMWQLFYVVEALLMHDLLRRTPARHVHVHFANNAADIARLLTHFGRAAGTGPWTWSLALHGPTEFSDVPGTDLAAKLVDASFVACISDYARSQAMALTPPDCWPSFQLVRMSVDAAKYPMADRGGRPAAPLRVLFVGRLVSVKGPDVLLDAVALLPPAEISLRVVGSGPLADHLRARVATMPNVELVGPLGQDELPAEYAAADAFCLPSSAEGLPVVLMEAMSTGLPVVTTRITGIPELVVDGETGVLVTPGRADLLAAAISELAASPEKRLRLGAAGRAKVLADHEAGTQADRLVELFAGVVGGS